MPIMQIENQNEKNEFTIGVKFAGFVLIRVWQLITRIQKHQRALTHAIKRARTIALLPYVGSVELN
jgi:hypothetical protein